MSRFLVPIFLLATFLISCGGDSSNVSSYEQTPESSSSVNDDSSSSIGDSLSLAKTGESSSAVKSRGSSSSAKTEESSSSKASDKSSSSMKNGDASSSAKTEESSSSKVSDKSSSSMKNGGSSSSAKTEESSSSVIVNESSSSLKTETSSSSEMTIESSSSVIVEESSSSILSSSSINSIYDAENNTLTDLRDNQVYKTVTIGEQIWMAENLNYMPEDTAGTIYSGGTVCGGGENNSLKDSEKCDTFGRLYLRKVALYKTTVSNRQGICPDGWSIPKKTDWEKLELFVEKDAGKLKVTGGAWSSGTNESGFSLKPAGMFFSQAYGYDQLKRSYLFYWSSDNKPYLVYICDEDNQFHYAHAAAEVMIGVRCLKD